MGAVERKVELVTLTTDQLRDVVEDAIRRALGQNDQSVEYLTLDEVAALLKSSTRSVKTWVKDLGLPAVRAGNEYRFRKDRVRAWLDSRPVKPGAHINPRKAKQ
jgi:excisionase family DNA binding protein